MQWHRPKPRTEKATGGVGAGQLHDLYWLGLLLTGDRQLSAETVVETLEMKGNEGPLSQTWMSWARRFFIAKAISRVSRELQMSVLRTEILHFEYGTQAKTLPVFREDLEIELHRPRLESALLKIDLFPRCALLLTVFERLSCQDAANLLNADAELVATGRAIGLTELASNLGRHGAEARSLRTGSVDRLQVMAS